MLIIREEAKSRASGSALVCYGAPSWPWHIFPQYMENMMCDATITSSKEADKMGPFLRRRSGEIECST